MKWILFALSGLALVALGAGTVQAHLMSTGGPAISVQVRPASAEPAKAGLQPLPANAQRGDLETVQAGLDTTSQAPETAPAVPGPMTITPSAVVVQARCGAVAAGRKPAPLCPPG
jgi:hypothetical protein